VHPVISAVLQRLSFRLLCLFVVSIIIFSPITGDLSAPVIDLVGPRLANTFFLASTVAIITIPLALLLGITAALYPGSIYERLVNTLTLTSISFPEFFVAYLLVLIFSSFLQEYPPIANFETGVDFRDRVFLTTLPVVTLTLVVGAKMLHMTRAAIINLMASPAIETAELEGASKSQVLIHHLLPKAWGLFVNVIAFNLAYLVVTVVVVEVVFIYPGVGQLMIEALRTGDVPVVQICALIISLAYLLLNLFAGNISINTKSIPSFTEHSWQGLKSAPPTAIFGLAIIAIYFIVAIFAPWLAPYESTEMSSMAYGPWDEQFIFGTDNLGRDVFSSLIYGLRNSIGIAVATTVLAFIIGGFLGIVAAVSRNWLDHLLSRSVDMLMVIPSLIFALLLLSMFGSNALNLIFIIAILDSTRVFKITRTLSLNAALDRVEDIFPVIMPTMLSEFGTRFCFVFLTIASLSFLGFGIQPPTVDLGSLVRETIGFIQFAEYDLRAAITPMLPAAAIALMVVAVNFVVDWFSGSLK